MNLKKARTKDLKSELMRREVSRRAFFGGIVTLFYVAIARKKSENGNNPS